MNQAGQYILAIIVLVFFSGLFSAIETAYSVASKIRLKNLYSDGDERAGEVLKILENFDRFLVTALIGNNVVNIITATVGTLLFTMWVGTNGPTVSTAVITILVLVFGEITPKSPCKAISRKGCDVYSWICKVCTSIINTNYMVDVRLAMDCK